MAHQSLYRRYRPQRFAEVVGQQHVVTALRNAVRGDRVGHAYLFSGPRGTGKTSTARILAKALNCLDPGADGEPCCQCDSCVAFQAGTSYDLHELDAASNNGVDAIRDLIAKVALGSPGRTKVYVLDEVHMLTSGAENALLKTLEEPPEHVVFVLATTEPHKVVSTIRSRTQHYEFELLPADALAQHVRWVIEDARLDVDDTAVEYVVRVGGGSARDTLSALDQVVAAGGVRPGEDLVEQLADAVCARDTGGALVAVNDAVRAGREPRVVGELLLARLRDAFLAAMGADLGHLSAAAQEQAGRRATQLGPAGLTRAIELVGSALVDMRQAPDPRVDLEVALARLTSPRVDTDLAAVVARLEALESGAGPAAGRPAQSAPVTAPARPQPAPAVERSPEPQPESSAPAGSAAAAAQPEAPPTPAGSSPAAEARARLAGTGGGKATLGAARGTARRTPPADEPPPPPGPAGDTPASDTPPSHAPVAGPAPSAAPPAPQPPDGHAEPPDGHIEPADIDAVAPTEAMPAGPPGATPAAPPPDASDSGPAPSAGSSAPGAMPSLDELTAAWEGPLRDRLPRGTKARFTAGRFVSSGPDRVEFGLPNAIHRDRCLDLRGDLENALAAQFGRPVPVALVVDDSDAPPPRDSRSGGPAPSGSGDDDEVIDLEDLEDAPDADSGIEVLTKAFPGAVLIEPPDA